MNLNFDKEIWEYLINSVVLPIKISVKNNVNDERLFLTLINNAIDEMNNHNCFKSSSEFNQVTCLFTKWLKLQGFTIFK